MNKDFSAGLFMGGIIALMIEGLLLAFAPDYLGLSALIWIIILDFILGIDLMIERFFK